MKKTDLTCGCCGCGFYTWPSYRDQDQDAGYGICRPCQADTIRRNRAHLAKAGELLRGALNDTNRAKYDRLTLWQRRAILLQCLDDGILTWTIA